MSQFYTQIFGRCQLPKTNKKNTLQPFSVLPGLFAAALLVVGIVFFSPLTAVAEEDYDLDTCATCHEDVVEAFKNNLHAVIDSKKIDKLSCTACHGDAALHVEKEGEAGTILTFKGESAMQKADACMKCHLDSNAAFMAGPHAKAGMDCTQCHSIHTAHKKSGLLRAYSSKLCASCHRDIVAQFQMNERHRLQEGILGCTSCHDAHGPAVTRRLAGFKHESCLKCHTDKGGPYFYEHEASRIEGCSACHEVHGSPNRHMLTHQNAAQLCFSCHTFAPSWHSYFTYGEANCVSCHSTIHGSNLDKLFLK